MKARIIHTKIWQDSFFADLTPTEKLVFIYLLTNERVNIVHCYECSDRVIAFETGVGRDAIAATKAKLEQVGKVRFYKDWIHLINGDRYQQFSGEKNEVAKGREFKMMPADVISWYNGESDTSIDTPIDGVSIPSVINNQYPVTSNKGGVGGERPASSIEWLDGLPDNDATDLADRFDIMTEQVKSKAEDLANYCRSHGKNYKDYRAFLVNAIKRDVESGRIRQKSPSKSNFIDLDALRAERTKP